MKSLSTILSLLCLAGSAVHCKSELPERVVGNQRSISTPTQMGDKDSDGKVPSKVPSTPTPASNSTPSPFPAPMPNAPGTGPAMPVPTNPSSSPLPSPIPLPSPSPGPTTPEPKPSDKPVALVADIDLTPLFLRVGSLNGWAADKNNPATEFDVNLYLDGDNKTGKVLGSLKADRTGPDGDVEGEHAFYFQVPDNFKDSKPHKVWVYVVVNGVETLLNSKIPYTMTFYSPKGGAAEAAFNKTDLKNGCGCHGNPPYIERWDMLNRDGTGKAWAADNNYLYNVLNKGHRGKTWNMPALIEWWKAEFAP